MGATVAGCSPCRRVPRRTTFLPGAATPTGPRDPVGPASWSRRRTSLFLWRPGDRRPGLPPTVASAREVAPNARRTRNDERATRCRLSGTPIPSLPTTKCRFVRWRPTSKSWRRSLPASAKRAPRSPLRRCGVRQARRNSAHWPRNPRSPPKPGWRCRSGSGGKSCAAKAGARGITRRMPSWWGSVTLGRLASRRPLGNTARSCRKTPHTRAPPETALSAPRPSRKSSARSMLRVRRRPVAHSLPGVLPLPSASPTPATSQQTRAWMPGLGRVVPPRLQRQQPPRSVLLVRWRCVARSLPGERLLPSASPMHVASQQTRACMLGLGRVAPPRSQRLQPPRSMLRVHWQSVAHSLPGIRLAPIAGPTPAASQQRRA
mmetsp:Transcript_160063/g.513536  ORF Transcript_160063/g.513536 Transcript_160063/m.513536 type:complete len:375 (-) Transcript_160063:615-1739(-)